jgi:hypothetical protein
MHVWKRNFFVSSTESSNVMIVETLPTWLRHCHVSWRRDTHIYRLMGRLLKGRRRDPHSSSNRKEGRRRSSFTIFRHLTHRTGRAKIYVWRAANALQQQQKPACPCCERHSFLFKEKKMVMGATG